jgi:predicted Rossmann fold nucleotide-binding protein DprA/Smf involved in DNA uptake
MERLELSRYAETVLTAVDTFKPVTVNSIETKTKLEYWNVISGLLELELLQIIKQLPGKQFIRIEGAV